jgi:hypothetical protein
MPTTAMMTMEQGRAAVAQLEACVEDVMAIDPKTIHAFSSEAQRLAAKIRRTLANVFGRNSPEYSRAVLTPSSFTPPSRPYYGPRTRAELVATFGKGQDLAVGNLVAEIELLTELFRTRWGLEGAETKTAAGEFVTLTVGSSPIRDTVIRAAPNAPEPGPGSIFAVTPGGFDLAPRLPEDTECNDADQKGTSYPPDAPRRTVAGGYDPDQQHAPNIGR